MKNIIRAILLSGIGILLFACNNNYGDNIFPDGYIKILSFKESGIIDLKMNTTQESVADSVLILKGGGNPNSVSNMELKVMTKEEAAAFMECDPDKVHIIPSDAYKLVKDENLKIEAEGRHKYVPVTFLPQKIYAEMKNYADDVVWVLPIALVSSSETINTSKDKVLFRFDVSSPLVKWNIEDMQNAEITFLSMEYPISVEVANSESNTLDFTCELDISENVQLVNDYNVQNGTTYELLPTASYSFDKFSFSAGEKVATSNLNLTRTGLQSDREYLLPLKMGTLSTSAIDKTDEIRYLLIKNPKYSIKELNRTDWKAVFSNSNRDSPKLIDNSFESAWIIPWWIDLAYTDDYDHGFTEYHSFSKRRNMPNAVIVFDLGREISFAGVGIGQGTNDLGDRDLKDCEFYLADTFTFTPDGDMNNYNTANKGNTWKFAINCTNIPNIGGGPYWYDLSSSELDTDIVKGRYLKIRPTGSHRNDPRLCSFSEVFAKEIVAIDGVALQ